MINIHILTTTQAKNWNIMGTLETFYMPFSFCPCIRAFQRIRINRMCIYVERHLLEGIGLHDYEGWQIKNLGGSSVWTPRRASAPADVQRSSAVEPGRADVADESGGSLLENSVLLGWGQSFCSLQAFSWLVKAHAHYGYQLVFLSPLS